LVQLQDGLSWALLLEIHNQLHRPSFITKDFIAVVDICMHSRIRRGLEISPLNAGILMTLLQFQSLYLSANSNPNSPAVLLKKS
jgi:hypothetical protein